MQNFVIWIQTASLLILKNIISANILQKMLKQDLALQILKDTDHYLKTKIKKVTRLMKDELGRLTMKDFD